MKLFEYLAAGLSVVASSTSELVRRAVPGVLLYSDISGFIRSLEVS